MPILHDKKALFLHIAKTGGTTIERYFKCSHVDNNELIGNYTLNKEFNIQHLKQCMTPEELIKYNLITEDILYNYFVFCFVRNPWDRLVSNYYDKGGNLCYGCFTDYVKYVEKLVKYVENTGREWIWCNGIGHVFKHQHEYLYYKNNKVVDFVGRFENYKEDFLKICNILDINIDQKNILHFKKSKHLPYQELYNKKTQKIVEEIYAKDIEFFGYSFEGEATGQEVEEDIEEELSLEKQRQKCIELTHRKESIINDINSLKKEKQKLEHDKDILLNNLNKFGYKSWRKKQL